MFGLFKSRAEAVSAEVHHFPTKTGALEFIIQLLHKEGIADEIQAYAVWADGGFLAGIDRKELAEKVPGLRFDVTQEMAAEAKIGITQMDWAIANTGTLAQDSAPVEQRVASSLPSIHIALVATDKLLSDLSSFFNKMSPVESRYIAMITGPSRTADIERVLTIGVHGPERLIIVFVDELGERNC
jgi:L-lactate dehydrogenase complex protein LldG